MRSTHEITRVVNHRGKRREQERSTGQRSQAFSTLTAELGAWSSSFATIATEAVG